MIKIPIYQQASVVFNGHPVCVDWKDKLNGMSKLSPPTFTLGNQLLPEQLHFFQDQGYIIFKNFLTREQVHLYLAELARVEQQLLAEEVDKVYGVPLKFGKDEEGNTIIQRFCFFSLFSKPLHQLLATDQRLQALTSLMHPFEGRLTENEKDGLVVNNYLRTANSTFSHMGWHTDSPRDLFMGQRIMPMLNVGIHLDDCPYENGGLRVIPGTHKQGILKLLFGKKYFIDHNPDPNEIGFDISAGDLTVHDGRLWHRVQQSPHMGEKSRRRVMYLPIVTGKVAPKNEHSKTPFYHRFTSKAHK